MVATDCRTSSDNSARRPEMVIGGGGISLAQFVAMAIPQLMLLAGVWFITRKR